MAISVGFLSDTHGSASAWKQAMQNGLADCDLVIHCGDVLYHGPRNRLPEGYAPLELAELINESGKHIFFVQGNCDASVDQALIDYPLQHPALLTYAAEGGILAHHGDALSSADVDRFCTAGGVRVVASGHTHLRVLRREGHVLVLNPGSCSLPKTPDQRPSFAILSRGSMRILDVRDGGLIEELSI